MFDRPRVYGPKASCLVGTLQLQTQGFFSLNRRRDLYLSSIPSPLMSHQMCYRLSGECPIGYRKHHSEIDGAIRGVSEDDAGLSMAALRLNVRLSLTQSSRL